MRSIKMNFLTAVILCAFACCSMTPSRTIAAEPESAIFADFDGDGINDNIEDGDSDGIPDDADPDYFPTINNGEQPADMIDFSGGLDSAGLTPDLLKNSDKFGKRRFCVRALTQNRCGFTSEEGFGAEGLGIGIGGSGGGCAGGICR